VRDAPLPFAWGDRLPTLTASRVVLRSLADGDASNLLEMFSHPDVMRYWSSVPLPDLDAARDLLRRIQELFRSQTLFQWGIARGDDDALIGTCSLFHVDFIHDRAELGFALARSSWGRGLASEAVSRLLRFAFDDMGMRRIEADTDPQNARSLKLLERQGFQREGLFRARYDVGASFKDSVAMGLLRDEWRGR
jgi:RimJ/RimL family protein N-acetyltransferase